jgi:hypothetical protein
MERQGIIEARSPLTGHFANMGDITLARCCLEPKSHHVNLGHVSEQVRTHTAFENSKRLGSSRDLISSLCRSNEVTGVQKTFL